MELYTSFGWAKLCAQVQLLRIDENNAYAQTVRPPSGLLDAVDPKLVNRAAPPPPIWTPGVPAPELSRRRLTRTRACGVVSSVPPCGWTGLFTFRSRMLSSSTASANAIAKYM
jgi:hypothetical protein